MSRLSPLPPAVDFENKWILKQLSQSYRALFELKGYADIVPNKKVLLNAVLINESRDSVELEDISATHDETLKAFSVEGYKNYSAEAVVNYHNALWHGLKKVVDNDTITIKTLSEIQERLQVIKPGLRKQETIEFKNEDEDDFIYTPPRSEQEIMALLNNLEDYINKDDETDPLLKTAVIHCQLLAINPFYSGNGRMARILSILFLIFKDLLDSPILHLSKYLNRNQEAYSINTRSVTVENRWADWILFFLKGIEEAAIETLQALKEIDAYINNTAEKIKEILPGLYKNELVDLLFLECYIQNKSLVEHLGVSRRTAYTYIAKLIDSGFLKEKKVGKSKIYYNEGYFELIKKTGTSR